MTHERTPGDEAMGGPQNDDRLPSADEVPWAPGPDDLAPVLWPDEIDKPEPEPEPS